MGRIHVITGLLTLGAFFLSGLYMMQPLNLPEQTMDVQRMMYRASHIYLLFIGCLNIVVGVYIEKESESARRYLQRLSSLNLIAAQPVFIAAFLLEPAVIDQDRVVTLIGCLLMLLGAFVALLTKVFSHYTSQEIGQFSSKGS